MEGYEELGAALLNCWQKPIKEAADAEALATELNTIGATLGAVLAGNIYEKTLGR